MSLRKEHEDLMLKASNEVREVKAQYEAKLEKSNQKCQNLEKAQAKILEEKKNIDEQMAQMLQQLEIVTTKMEERNKQIKQK